MRRSLAGGDRLHRGRRESQRQLKRPAGQRVAVLNWLSGIEAQLGHSPQHLLKTDSHFQLRKVNSETVMRTNAECHLLGCVRTSYSQHFGLGERVRITV